MKLARLVSLSLGMVCAVAAAACGSSGVDQFPGYTTKGGEPASAQPVRDGGSSSSSGGGGSSGGSSGSSGGGAEAGSFGPQTLATFTLIDATVTNMPSGSPIMGFDPIPNGATIDLGVVGLYLSMRADPPPVATVGSIAFALDATYTHTAETMPFSLCGDDGKGNFIPCVLPVGKHTLTATLYPMSNLGGEPYQPPTVFEFTVIDSTADGGTDADAY